MTANEGIELHKPILGELDYGMLPFGHVPVIDDVLQVGLFVRNDHPRADLTMIVGERAIILGRADGQALQVADNDKADGSGQRPPAIELFIRPISELVFSNTIATEDTYHVTGEGLEIPDLRRFDKFVTQIFLYAYRQQHPEARPAEILELLDAYGEF
jgi:hypothetical protein